MKLHETAVIQNLESFITQNHNKNSLLRSTFSTFMFWSIFDYFKPMRMVEVGFGVGQTAALMVDSGAGDVTSVDLRYKQKPIFEQFYPSTNISFNTMNSADMEYTRQYDFIHIDGDHTFKGAETDLLKLLPCTHADTIIAMDDFESPGVSQVIEKHLVGQHGFVPFLNDDQCMFFHKGNHNANDFIDDHLLKGPSTNFATYQNERKFDHIVFTGSVPVVFYESLDIFRSTIKFYNI